MHVRAVAAGPGNPAVLKVGKRRFVREAPAAFHATPFANGMPSWSAAHA